MSGAVCCCTKSSGLAAVHRVFVVVRCRRIGCALPVLHVVMLLGAGCMPESSAPEHAFEGSAAPPPSSSPPHSNVSHNARHICSSMQLTHVPSRAVANTCRRAPARRRSSSQFCAASPARLPPVGSCGHLNAQPDSSSSRRGTLKQPVQRLAPATAAAAARAGVSAAAAAGACCCCWRAAQQPAADAGQQCAAGRSSWCRQWRAVSCCCSCSACGWGACSWLC